MEEPLTGEVEGSPPILILDTLTEDVVKGYFDEECEEANIKEEHKDIKEG